MPVPQESSKSGNINGDDKQIVQDSQRGEITLYYAMWCGITRQMLPEWEKFVAYAESNLPYVKVSSVRCENGNEAECDQKGIPGFPTIILGKGDQEFMFDKEFSERTSDNFTKFVQKHLA